MSESVTGKLAWRDSATTILLLILLLALALRVWGIWFGLPFLFHNDEGFEVIRALQLGAGEFDFGRISKGGYFYLLFVEYGVLFVAFMAAGVVNSANEFAELYLSDPTSFYLVGRATTAIIGTLTVYFVFRVARLAYSTRAALIAAALLAFNILHADLSHYITVDVPMTCLAVISLYFAIRVAQEGSTRAYWWAALFAAFATTTKIPAGLLVLSLLIAHFYAVRSVQGGIREFLVNRSLWQGVAIFVVAYLVLTPGMVLYGGDMFWHVLGKFGIGSGAEFNLNVPVDDEQFEVDEDAMFMNTNLFVFYARVLVDSMTWPIFVLCVIGLLVALWRRRVADIVLGSFAIATYLVISVSVDIKQFFPRYALPILPVLAIFGGRLIDVVLDHLPRRRWSISSVVVLSLLLVWPVSQIMSADYLMTQTDTRALAREWFDENVPHGARVFIEGHRTVAAKSSVPLQNTKENMQESIEYYRDHAPGRARYFQTMMKVQTGSAYDLVGVRPTELRSLDFYKRDGVQYFVLRPENYPGSRLHFHWSEFVDAIRSDPEIVLLRRFEAAGRPGPTIEIYRVNSNIG